MLSPVRHHGARGRPGLRLLIIIDLPRWDASGRAVPQLPGVTYADFTALTPELLDRVKPDIVLSPLTADAFDAGDVAVRLAACGFRGRYRAVTQPVADPNTVGRDIRDIAPDVDFALFEFA